MFVSKNDTISGPVGEEGVDPLAVEMVGRLVLQVAAGLGRAVGDPGLPRMWIAGDPEHPPDRAEAPPNMGLLLDDDHVETAEPRGDRGGETAGTGADDERVRHDGRHGQGLLGGWGVARNSQ